MRGMPIKCPLIACCEIGVSYHFSTASVRFQKILILYLMSSFQVMMGIIQTGTNEGRGRAGVMLPVPGYSLYQARLLQHNSYQVTRPA